ncbi:MAG: diguanylate phosphodiesterase [Sulfurimonas sp. GWF2_37_8]|nr:MAG: diguanylate phosphodiesterase [Sulfurimonas sp. GWF2_37_8]
MENELSQTWLDKLAILDFAFQPIFNIHTGKIYGVEALLRNYQEIGCKSIFALFDEVYKHKILYTFDIHLRDKALAKFTQISNYEELKLFYNLDNRLFDMPDFSEGNTKKILQKYNIQKKSICFEISERHEISGDNNFEQTIEHYKSNDYCIAIDDFGVGYSGYKLLYDSTPDILKIDRFFLSDIEQNVKKQLMVRSITHLAIQLGIQVIAEGVETAAELLTCQKIGCHFVQGYFVQRPTLITEEITTEYKHIQILLQQNKRVGNKPYEIKTYIEQIPSLSVTSNMSSVVDFYNNNKSTSILPIVYEDMEPLGIIQESTIKEYLYSPFGRSLLLNEGSSKSKLKKLITPCGIADINSDITNIIELFSNNPESLGIIITNNAKYYGFLSARAIITIMNEQNLLYAKEQNPLTKLPGNAMIEKYMAQVNTDNGSYLLCYFDLDNFKAFNDVYGFRNGDRVILLFADILKKQLSKEYFVAHIGGDDFFAAVAFDDMNEQQHIDVMSDILKKFTEDVKSFYHTDDRNNGYIQAKDREGNMKIFPLLSVSASIVIVKENKSKKCLKTLNAVLSLQKKYAKNERNHLCMSSLI